MSSVDIFASPAQGSLERIQSFREREIHIQTREANNAAIARVHDRFGYISMSISMPVFGDFQTLVNRLRTYLEREGVESS